MKTHPEDGITIAPDAPGAISQTPGAPPETLADLLARIERNSTQKKMVFSVTARFLEYMNSTAEKAPIEALITEKESFISYLKAGKYKASSVKTYRNYINILIRTAEGMGWARPKIVIPPVWQSLLDGTARSSIKPIVLYAIRIGRTPSTLSEDDLSAWQQERAKADYSLEDARGDCSRLRTSVVNSGLSDKFPLIKPRDKRYGVPVAQMHPELRQEVEELLEWKTSDFQLDRPSGARIRPISAKRLSDLLGQLTGYVQNVANKPEVTNIASLVTRDNVARFTTWAKNTRKVKGQSLSTGLGMVFAAVRHNPPLRFARPELV